MCVCVVRGLEEEGEAYKGGGGKERPGVGWGRKGRTVWGGGRRGLLRGWGVMLEQS